MVMLAAFMGSLKFAVMEVPMVALADPFAGTPMSPWGESCCCSG